MYRYYNAVNVASCKSFVLNVHLTQCNCTAADRCELTCDRGHVPAERTFSRSLHVDTPTVADQYAAAGVAVAYWQSRTPSCSRSQGRREVGHPYVLYAGDASADRYDQNVARSRRTDTAMSRCWCGAYVHVISYSTWMKMTVHSQDVNICHTRQPVFHQTSVKSVTEVRHIQAWNWTSYY